MPPPAISVIIPVRNAALTLPATLASIASQTVQVTEIVVVDDGSAVHERSFLDTLAPDIRVVRRSIEHPSGSARRLGATLACCPWLAFLEPRDLWYPEHLERQLDCFARFPNTDAVHAAAEPLRPAADRPTRLDRPTFSSLLVNRQQLLRVDNSPTGESLLDDPDFATRMTERGLRVVALDAVLVRVGS